MIFICVCIFSAFSGIYCILHMQTFSRPEATSAGHTQYAADISGRILKFFEGYFGIDYPQTLLSKLFQQTCYMPYKNIFASGFLLWAYEIGKCSSCIRLHKMYLGHSQTELKSKSPQLAHSHDIFFCQIFLICNFGCLDLSIC